MDRFLVEQLINFFGGLLVESSLILAMDRSLDYKAFHPHSLAGQPRFDYLKAAYFVVSTFSTVGYGDIYPIKRVARVFMIMILVVNIIVMSNYIGNLISQIYSSSHSYEISEFKDHVVVVGNIPEAQLIEFLEELVENDNV